MKNDIIRAEVVSTKIISNLSDDLIKELGMKPEHRCIALITGSIDDVTFIALDEATKSADVEVIYAECTFSAFVGNYTKFAGEAVGILAGPSPSEVNSGLEAAMKAIENGAYFKSANDEGTSIYLSHCISRTGSYLSKIAGIEEGEAMSYLIAPPIEAMNGLDAALKAADVKLVSCYKPPTATSNFGGGLLTGSQSACKAACDAFEEAVQFVANNPITF